MTKIKLLTSSAYMALALIAFLPAANAAFTICNYSPVACDQSGNHFECEITGWTGPDTMTFCSAVDRSNGPGATKASGQMENAAPPAACGDCYGEPKPSAFCQSTCNCLSAFCGSW